MFFDAFTKARAVPGGAWREQWEREGFLILEGFISPKHVQRANAEVQQLIESGGLTRPNIMIDVLHGEYSGRRLKVTDTPLSAYKGPVKINDLYLESHAMRSCNLDRRLISVLRALLDDDPIIINSLNFLYGSQQPPHYDTWFMPPPVEGAMAVASICLDEMTAFNGPLIYYPGSHRLPPYRFSHGGINAIIEELPACEEYVQKQVEAVGLKQKSFFGKPGDVFIWHAQLLHGGAPIADPELTRRSLVTHFWRRRDVEPERVQSLGSRRYYLKRPHQLAS